MKISVLTLFLIFFSTSLFANNPALDKNEKKTTQELEISNLIEELFDKNVETFEPKPKSKFRIVIMDNQFNKIREESFEKMDNIYKQSILIPLIYRSDLITNINGVSYYILR